jgi:(p)ppGpp synthase/HD superfamily hydrolase
MGGTESNHLEHRQPLDVYGAIELAENAHRGATDKAGRPYMQHVRRVVSTVHTNTERMTAALHDVVEDTPTTLEDLTAAGCPTEVVAAVDALTRRAGESYDSFLERVARNELARRVKVADLMDNSDESRLALLSPEEAKRLRAKYRRAIESLDATQEVASRREERRLEDK